MGRATIAGFTFVDDCVEALVACLDTPETCGKVYNLGGCEPVNLIQLADALTKAAGQGEYSIKEFPADRKKIDIGDYYSADKAFRDATGWRHRTSLHDALKQTVDYYRTRMEAYQ